MKENYLGQDPDGQNMPSPLREGDSLWDTPPADPAAAGDRVVGADWTDLSLDQQAKRLLDCSDRMRISTFVSAALRVGVRRMDSVREAQGHPPVHEQVLDHALASPKVLRRFDAGFQEVITPDTWAATAVRKHVDLVSKHVDWQLNNPALAHNAVGLSRPPNSMAVGGAVITQAIEGVMRTEKWPDHLRALAAAVGMHQIAMRKSRQAVSPLLQIAPKLPTVKEGAEQLFWNGRLFGVGDNEGVCYYLGYIEKSRARLRRHMEKIWGGRYEDNRQVFLATLLLRAPTYNDPKRKKELRAIRQPLYQALAQDDFDGAAAQLTELAATRPRLFSAIGLEYFRGGKNDDPIDTSSDS